jgi:predicted dienelactone hydrolase
MNERRYRPSASRRRVARRACRGSLLTALTCLAGCVLASPVASASARTPRTTPTPAFGVGLARCTFVDHSRPLLNYATTPSRLRATSRTLTTEIRYPTTSRAATSAETLNAPPAARSGGYPTIVFAHGYDVTPDTYKALLDTWVRAGFVVVAPFFPDESASAVAAQPGVDTEDDLANEPGDLAFVTRAILSASAATTSVCPVIHGLVAPSQLALAGHSDGAVAVGMLAYDHGVDPQGVNYAAARAGLSFRAVIILSGARENGQSYASEASRPDLLDVQSLFDQCNPFREGAELYDSVHQSNKWFLELQRAHHLPPFDNVDRSAFAVVSSTTIRFLQLSLEGTRSPANLVTLGNQRPAVARMFSGPEGPSLAHLPDVKEDCGPN